MLGYFQDCGEIAQQVNGEVQRIEGGFEQVHMNLAEHEARMDKAIQVSAWIFFFFFAPKLQRFG